MKDIDYNKLQRNLYQDDYDSDEDLGIGDKSGNVNIIKKKKLNREKKAEETVSRINTEYELPSKANNKIYSELKNIEKSE